MVRGIKQAWVALNVMEDIVGHRPSRLFNHLAIQLIFLVNLAQLSRAQVYNPIFKALEMQATIAPLGEMVVGDFYGHTSIAAIARSEKAIYFFDPDSLENLILTNVVSLPDTPIAISKGKEIIIDTTKHSEGWEKIAVLMKSHYAALISFGKGGQPIVSREVRTDPYCTDIRTADLEASGDLDLVTFGRFSLGIAVARNTGAGRFVEAQPIKGVLGNIPFSDMVFTDFNGDLVPDIAALDWVNHRLLIFYGRGDGTFAQPVSFQLKAEPSTLAVADLNGNGYPDIVLGYTRVNRVDIYGGDGFGRFFLRQTLKTAGPVSKFAIADFTGDGTTDIAALSEVTKEITTFSYDPLTKNFRYAGTIGIGSEYDDIVPFYFSNRIEADLVASSLTQKFIKVFKSAVSFNKSPDILVPVCSSPEFLSVCGNDTSNYLIVGNSAGKVSVRYSGGIMSTAARSAVDWQSEGLPNLSKVVSGTPPHLLLSYRNADMISLYEVARRGRGVAELNAETAFLPFATAGEVENDSAVIAAAYRVQPDSSVGVSFFRTIRGKDEFIEQDYSVDEKRNYVTSALAVNPSPSFLRVWRMSKDSLVLAYTDLSFDKTVTSPLRGSGAELIDNGFLGYRILVLMGDDTLSMYGISLAKTGQLTMAPICRLQFDNFDFSSIRITFQDSICYMTAFNKAEKSVFLYTAKDGHLQFVKSWHVVKQPEDVAVSPAMNNVFFLNKSESYVSIHYF